MELVRETTATDPFLGQARAPEAFSHPAEPITEPVIDATVDALVGQKLSVAAFLQLSGRLAGYPFVKVVVDRQAPSERRVHFIHHSSFPFHADYIGVRLLGVTPQEVDRRIDEFNRLFYLSEDRRFFLGIISLHSRAQEGPGKGERFFSLETVEIDTMDEAMIREFYAVVREALDPTLPVLFKPANHFQERIFSQIDPAQIPRVLSHELFSAAQYVALNPGKTVGKIRAFRSEEDYRRVASTIDWQDIVVMHSVPDDIPRVAGIINAHQTTPLSHTNVLATGWQVPNAIQIGILDRIDREKLHEEWVEYTVSLDATSIGLKKVSPPAASARPAWSVHRIKLEEPETHATPVMPLDRLRLTDRYKYGTKAANLGELGHVLAQGSHRLTGFYKVRRPPRANLLPHLAELLGLPETEDPADIAHAAEEFLKGSFQVPRGIAIPFSVQQEFLESSPRIQQMIGKLKMALELNVREVDSLCFGLQGLIRSTRMPEKLKEKLDEDIAAQLSGVSSFVVRSSSNAEDLQGFSAAGIYESINHVSNAEKIFESIKEVWASLLSPRSVRLRQEVGISLDDCYMGVVIQEEVPSEIGGVLVTANPMNKADFRNVFINASPKSVVHVVHGEELPLQYLYNTVEGGGRTLSLGSASADLSEERRDLLQRLAIAGRLLQSHFSPDYTFASPVDIEWAAWGSELFILQLRPYSV